MTKVTLSILLLFFSACNFLDAQITFTGFKKEKNINFKAQMALQLENVYTRNSVDSLKMLGVYLLAENDNKSALANAVGYKIIGLYQRRIGEYEKALINLKRAVKFFEREEDNELTSELYNSIGLTLYLLEEYDEAIISFNTSLRIGKLCHSSAPSFNAKLGLSKALISKKDYLGALKASKEYTFSCMKNKYYESASNGYATMGDVYLYLKDTIKSESCFKKSISLPVESNVHLGNQWSNKGIFYFQMNDFDSSLYCFEQSLEVRKKLNNPKDLLESYYNLAEYYKARNEINKAIIYFDRAREIANKSNLFDDQIDVLKQLVYCWKALNQFDNAQDAQLILTSLESNKQEKWGIDNDVIEFAISPIVNDDTTFQKSSNTLEYFLVSITVILGIFILRKKF